MQDIILIAIGFIMVHLFKMIRLYLVLMEHKIPFGRFVLLYFRTTLVNLLIPFKLGELYRVEEVWRLTGFWQVGILSVVVDRYFDILALFMFLLPMYMIYGPGAGFITAVFALVIVFGGLLYLCIPSSFEYLNRFLIQKRASTRSVAALRGLDVVKDWYDFTADLIRGRALMITIVSAFGWGAEILTLKKLADHLGLLYRLRDFGTYISSLFLAGGQMQIQRSYTGISVAAMCCMTILGYAVLLLFRLQDLNHEQGS